MYRRNFWLFAFCALLVFTFIACSNGTDEDPENIWLPSRYVGTYENTESNRRIVLDNSGFTAFNKNGNTWENNRKGWSEINYAGTKFRFTYTELWSNGAWQSISYSETYNYSWNGNFTFSGDVYDAYMKGTWIHKETGGNGSKPAQLVPTATYQETMDKLDEIIEYCDNNPGPGNANLSLKSFAEARKGLIAPLESIWSSVRDTHIPLINSNIIDQLQ